MIKTGIGQDSHRIQEPAAGKDLVLGGVTLKEPYALEGNSDSDVVLHAITNAISGITGKPILGPVADGMCKAGITDSAAYLQKALEDLDGMGYRLSHLSVSLECQRPKILPILYAMTARIADLTGLSAEDVGITATTGEGLTDFGKGLGIQGFAIATAILQGSALDQG
ncbi:MAG: 2-C-methyl-D-erythritol 2,4-cyclodiphosphate synthase [Fibrobacteria bacterium]